MNTCLKNPTENDLLKKHAPMVAVIVNQLVGTLPALFSRDHLQGLGLIALLRAVRSHAPAGGVSFETFARIEIHRALLCEIRRVGRWGKIWFNGTAERRAPLAANPSTSFQA